MFNHARSLSGRASSLSDAGDPGLAPAARAGLPCAPAAEERVHGREAGELGCRRERMQGARLVRARPSEDHTGGAASPRARGARELELARRGKAPAPWEARDLRRRIRIATVARRAARHSRRRRPRPWLRVGAALRGHRPERRATRVGREGRAGQQLRPPPRVGVVFVEELEHVPHLSVRALLPRPDQTPVQSEPRSEPTGWGVGSIRLL